VSRAALLLVVCVSLLAGCGEQPDDPPAVFEVKVPRGTETAEFAEAGMALEHPANWRLRRSDAPGVFELLSGETVVAGWAYPREEPLPADEAELEAAKDRLVEAIEERDPEFRVDSVTVGDVGGAPSIDVRGAQALGGRELSTRSVHVFEGEVEYVIEALAPPADFDLVEQQVMAPLLASLELEGEVAEDSG
jgi:hypothetical protein